MLCSDYYLTSNDLHNNLLPKKLIKANDGTGDITLTYPYKNEPIYDLYVLNSKETIENKMNFSRQFFGYVKFKQYNLSFLQQEEGLGTIVQDMKTIRTNREEELNNTNIEGIYNAPDIDKEEYVEKVK